MAVFCRPFVPDRLLPAALLGQGRVDSRWTGTGTGAGRLRVLRFWLGNRVNAGRKNEAAVRGAGPCRGRGLGEPGALPGLGGGAALRTLLYHGVELTLSAKRSFR